MKSWSYALVAGILLVAAAAFFLGRSTPRRPPVVSPESGAPAPAAAPQAAATAARAGTGASETAGAAAPAVPGLPSPPAATRTAPAPPTSITGGTYANQDLKVRIETPKAGGWVMVDNPLSFRAPVHPPSMRLEIHRDPTAGDPRLGVIEFHVLDVSPGFSESQEIVKLERPAKSAKIGTYQVTDEGPADIGGLTFQRRLTLWDARDTPLAKQDPRIAETKILSVSACHNGKFYAFIAYAPADQFDSLRPEIDQTVQSLRLH